MLSAHPTESEAVIHFLANSAELKIMRDIAKNEVPTIGHESSNNEPPREVKLYFQRDLIERLDKVRDFATIIETTNMKEKLGNYSSAFQKIAYVGSFFSQQANFAYQFLTMGQKATEFAKQYNFAVESVKPSFT